MNNCWIILLLLLCCSNRNRNSYDRCGHDKGSSSCGYDFERKTSSCGCNSDYSNSSSYENCDSYCDKKNNNGFSNSFSTGYESCACGCEE